MNQSLRSSKGHVSYSSRAAIAQKKFYSERKSHPFFCECVFLKALISTPSVFTPFVIVNRCDIFLNFLYKPFSGCAISFSITKFLFYRRFAVPFVYPLYM